MKGEVKVSFLEKVRSLVFGYPEDEYETYDGYDEEDYDEMQENHNDQPLEPFFSRNKKVVSIANDNMKSNSKDFRVVIYNPTTFSEASSIVDSLRSGKAVVIDLKDMKEKRENGEVVSEFKCQKEMFDFLNGAIYAIDGSLRKLSSTIFILAPENVDVDSNLENELSRKGNNPWISQSAL